MEVTLTRTQSTSGSRLVQAAEALKPLLEANADAIEERRRLTPEVYRALLDGGFFRLTMPAEFSGMEMTLPEAVRGLEALAQGDASVAWIVWASCGVPAMAAFMLEEGARELFSAADACLVGSLASMGRAVAQPGGYRVTGRWPFASGIHNATWAGGLCFVFDGEEQRMTPDGQPAVIGPIWPVQSCRVIDVWDTTGLRGTGSDEMEAEDLFVLEKHVVDFGREPRTGLGPLHYVHEDNLANVTCAAMGIGIAGAVLQAFRDLGYAKKSVDGAPLAESPLAKQALARAEMRFAQARGQLYETVDLLWEEIVEGRHDDQAWLSRTALASVGAVDAAIEVVTGLYRAAGTSAIFRSRGFDRRLRDLFTLAAHRTVQHANLLLHGGATFTPPAAS